MREPAGKRRGLLRARVSALVAMAGVLLWLAAAGAGSAARLSGAGLGFRAGQIFAADALFQTAGVPAAPSDLWVGSNSPTAVGLNWTDHSQNETGYDVWRQVATGNWMQIGEAPAHAICFIDAAVMPEVPYTYRVRTRAGDLVSDWSNEAAITLPRVPPAPTGLTAAAAGSTRVWLSWAGQSEDGSFFSVWRRDLAGPSASDFVHLNWGPGHFFNDESVDPSTRYVYRVRADNPFYSSGWSNEVAVRTPAPPAGISVQAAMPAPPPQPDATGRTRVVFSDHIPAGYVLDRNPFVIDVDPSGAVAELLPAYTTQGPPDGQGYRDLNTGNYPAGDYRVRAQIDYLDPSGQPGSAASPWMPLTISPPALASLTLAPAAAAGPAQVVGTVNFGGARRSQPALVTLSSSDPAVAAVPASVSVPDWEYHAEFLITVSAVAKPQIVTITARWDGVSVSAPLTVTPAAGTAGSRANAVSRP